MARVGLLVATGVVASGLLAMSPASAAVSAGASLSVPDGASVGTTNLAASVTVTNQNSAPNQAEGNTITEIRFVPSCGSMGTAANPCPTPDPGVFSLAASATGAAGTACAGRMFTVSGPDASGAFSFTVSGAAVVLAPPGGAAGANRCTINFTINALKVPQIDVSANPGVQTWVNLRARVTSSSGLMPVPVVSRMVTVSKGVVGLTTQASPSVPVGGTIADNATLSRTAGAAVPTGTVAFSAFGPDNAACTGTPMSQSTNPVAGTGSATSASFPVTQPGVYRFVAVYSGDANYVTRTSPCGSAGESVTVTGRQGHAVADFNGDGRTDLSVYRPSNGNWLIQGLADTQWGASTDIPVPGDYNGDGRTDIAVFRPSTGYWYVLGISTAVLGSSTDVPVPGDYDGDGRTDFAVFRPSTGQWFVGAMPAVTFGASGDIPVPGDYNGDGKTDIAVFRPSTGHWLVRGISDTAFGTSTDIPLPLPYAIRRTLSML